MDGVFGGFADIAKGGLSVALAPVEAVTKTVGTVLSAPFKGAKTLLVGNGENELNGSGGGDINSAFNAAMNKAEQS